MLGISISLCRRVLPERLECVFQEYSNDLRYIGPPLLRHALNFGHRRRRDARCDPNTSCLPVVHLATPSSPFVALVAKVNNALVIRKAAQNPTAVCPHRNVRTFAADKKKGAELADAKVPANAAR
jgi:hypothetical protein